MKRSLNKIMEKSKGADAIIIIGAGLRGKEILAHLKENAFPVICFFDNNETLTNTCIDGVKIMKPYKVEEKNVLYIIAVDSPQNRKALLAQMQSLGVNDSDIVIYYSKRDYDYMSTLEEKYYQEELQDIYYERFGKKINWSNPVTYNEKLNWEKLHVRDERKTRLADKLLVRDWIREQIGEKHLTRLYGVWDDADEIDFTALPDAFALKLNHASGSNIIVKDKSAIDEKEVRRQLNRWKDFNHAYMLFELHYRDIVPKIICEEYLEGVAETVYDYNIFCFHGEPAYIWCIKGSHRPECRASFYTKDWEMMPFSLQYPRDNIPAPRPEKLDEMLELSRFLSKDFEHVRVDWYNLPDGRVLFCEMTFASWGGMGKWEPEEYDTIFGNMI